MNMPTIIAGLAAGVESTNPYNLTTKGFGLVLDLANELAQSNIGNSQRQPSILDHPFDVQVFHTDKGVG